jgi:transposase
LGDDLKFLDMSIGLIDCEIKALCKLHPRYKALLSIPGCGPIVAASFMSEVGSGEQFKNERQASVWCGLVPIQSSSSGKIRLGNITKNGCSELRVLLIHGALAVSRFAAKRDDTLGKWLNSLSLRRRKHKAIVALANKLARIAWHILTDKNEFIVSKAFA